MPFFCKCGADEYICQQCGRIKCSREEYGDRIVIPRTGREGNVCPLCLVDIRATAIGVELNTIESIFANKT